MDAVRSANEPCRVPPAAVPCGRLRLPSPAAGARDRRPLRWHPGSALATGARCGGTPGRRARGVDTCSVASGAPV